MKQIPAFLFAAALLLGSASAQPPEDSHAVTLQIGCTNSITVNGGDVDFGTFDSNGTAAELTPTGDFSLAYTVCGPSRIDVASDRSFPGEARLFVEATSITRTSSDGTGPGTSAGLVTIRNTPQAFINTIFNDQVGEGVFYPAAGSATLNYTFDVQPPFRSTLPSNVSRTVTYTLLDDGGFTIE